MLIDALYDAYEERALKEFNDLNVYNPHLRKINSLNYFFTTK